MSGTRSCGRSQPLTAAHILRSHGRSPSFVRNDFEAGKNANATRRPSAKNRRAQVFLLRFAKSHQEPS